jgi:sugar transferase (PEP-CTERM/EpsH1 system associated)
MKICMIVSRVPWPLEKGDKLRAYHQLKHLSKNHEVHLICLSDGGVDVNAINQLQLLTPHVHVFQLNRWKMFFRIFMAFFSSKPFQVHYFYDRAIAGKVRRLIEDIKPNAIYCQLIRCSEYVKHLHAYVKTLDYMDALSAGQHRRAVGAPWYLAPFVREEARRLTAYEHLIFDYFEHHTIISEQDRKLIYHANCERIEVVPNGIDAEYFKCESKPTKIYDLVFTGNMSYPPNVEGARRLVNSILPLVLKHRPGIKLLLAGASPSSAVRALESEGVVVSGWLDDIRTAYNEARIFVAPMQSGSGMQNKLLEAMCMELPCVTTALAAAPLGVTHGKECYIGQTDEELANHILSLLDNPHIAQQIGETGRLYVQGKFDWASSTGILESRCFGAKNS